MQSKATSLETQKHNEIDKNEIRLFDLSLLHIGSLSIFYMRAKLIKKKETM